MAASALRRIEIEPRIEFDSIQRFRLIGAFSGRLAKASLCDPTAFSEEANGLNVSSRTALGGAKAVMIAIGIEAAAVICSAGVWQLWRILR